ncbi:hypothetical protein ACR77J_07660 [Tissierella praeacuta]|uniref:hypothetical protein n=1 Tax=Tissierella praeacuta TaxID=43131 RepID=UPI003DA51110
MWIISYNTDYYPWIEIFDTYEKAKERYDSLKKRILDEDRSCYDDDCVFLSEVKKYTKGKAYDIEYEE